MRVIELEKLIIELSDSRSLMQLQKVCLSFCALSGFEFYSLGVCNVSSFHQPEITRLTNYPESWTDLYYRESLQKHDPIIHYCLENAAPITWRELQGIQHLMSSAARQVLARARQFGLAEGLAIPIKAPSGEVCIFNFATSATLGIDQVLSRTLPYAYYFVTKLLEAYLRINKSIRCSMDLTKREKECLFWACEGKTAWEMSQIMEVSERTATFHLASVTKKLGASNRQHAVAKAVFSGLVRPAM